MLDESRMLPWINEGGILAVSMQRREEEAEEEDDDDEQNAGNGGEGSGEKADKVVADAA